MKKIFFLFAVLVTASCSEKSSPSIESSSLSSDCVTEDLYDFNDYGALHNYYLQDILENNVFNEDEDLTIQIEQYVESEHNITVSLEEVLNGDPYSDFTEIIDRSDVSEELRAFALPFLEELFSAGLLQNKEYQEKIFAKANTVESLSSKTDRNRARTFLAVLSHSIYFWLPEKYCGMNGIAYVSDYDFNNDIQKRGWLTNFADIWSHDLVGGLVGGGITLTPVGAALGFAGTSAARAVTKAWAGDY